jgi:hypothetical protein
MNKLSKQNLSQLPSQTPEVKGKAGGLLTRPGALLRKSEGAGVIAAPTGGVSDNNNNNVPSQTLQKIVAETT